MATKPAMHITYLGHAGFCVETPRAIVITDPWLSAHGAFDSAWFQFPRNHHMAALVREKLSDSRKERFIYISHEHKDHFDPEFLNSLQNRDFTVIVPHFQRPALRHALADYRPKALISFSHGQEVAIPGGYLKLYLDDSAINRDSAILIKAEGHSFLDLNDCKLYDALPSIVQDQGPIDVFTCQFSGATWHPTCYDYPREVYGQISEKKSLSKFETVARAIETLRPRVFLPSAGPACFLDPMLLHLNFEPVNIFPHAPRLQQHATEPSRCRCSLKMIADAVGVTKAAVYHQYNTKDEIVLAAAEAELERVDAVVRIAESEPSRLGARRTLITGMVDLAVARRRTASSILNDPVIVSFFAEHASFRPVMDRMTHVLVGDDVGHEGRVSTAMLTAAISGTVMHPLVAGLDDDVLRSQLLRLAQRLLPPMNTKTKRSQPATRR